MQTASIVKPQNKTCLSDHQASSAELLHNIVALLILQHSITETMKERIRIGKSFPRARYSSLDLTCADVPSCRKENHGLMRLSTREITSPLRNCADSQGMEFTGTSCIFYKNGHVSALESRCSPLCHNMTDDAPGSASRREANTLYEHNSWSIMCSRLVILINTKPLCPWRIKLSRGSTAQRFFRNHSEATVPFIYASRRSRTSS
jgi:hypothetical protein